MKITIKRKAALVTAILLIAVITFAMPIAAMAAEVTTVPENVNLVTTKGSLTVTVPTNISTNISVSAYEMLRLVVPKGSQAPAAMTNDSNSKNLYIVTNNWVDFFASAKEAYTATTGTVISNVDTLYLTYNTSNNKLEFATTAPEGRASYDYIVIDNAAYAKDNATNKVTHIGKLDKIFFEADLVSRIINTPATDTEATASDARLLSTWASRYVKAKGFDADATRTVDAAEKKAVLADLTYGYYIVVASDTSGTNEGKTAINQSILNVPDATGVTLKASPITVDKSVDNLIDANRKNNNETNKKNNDLAKYNTADPTATTGYDKITANIGDILQYKVETHIPALTSYVFTADSSYLLGITNADSITEANFDDVTAPSAGRFVFVVKDKMINQDFIALDGEIQGAEGMKMEVKNSANTVIFTGVIKKITVDGTDGLYLVKSTEADNVTAANVADEAYGRLWETNYSVASNRGSSFFALTLVLPKIKAASLDGKDAVFTYNAQLMGEAGNSGNTNSAGIRYSNDPFNPISKDDITVDNNNNVYTFDIKPQKVFSDGSTTEQYSNVKFKLFTDQAMEHPILFVKDASGANDGKYTRADSNDETTTQELTVNTTDGTLQLHGLGEGIYYLKEQTNDNLTNAGYNIANAIKVTISAKANGQIIDTENVDLYNGTTKGSSVIRDEVSLDCGAAGTNEYAITFDVLNQKGFHLPLTGEYGNWLLAISGLLLVAVGGTVIILVNRKKRGGGVK